MINIELVADTFFVWIPIATLIMIFLENRSCNKKSIDMKTAKEILDVKQDIYASNFEAAYMETCCLDAMEKYAQQFKPKMIEWISVKDKLPESGTYILSFSPCYNSVSKFKDGCFFDGKDRLYNVTHWMPLPSPPIQKSEGGEDV